MVNIEAFAKRLEKLLDHYDLSASSFADRIEVGRSSISHILSGRNKPSLDFILKVLQAFPDINLYWLMNGTGPFLKSEQKGTSVLPQPNPTPSPSSLPEQKEKLETSEPVREFSSSKEISRIVIFYSDGSFETFHPKE